MEALKKKKSTTKGQLTRLRQQIEAILKKEMTIESLAKLRAIRIEYRRLRDIFDATIVEILAVADDKHDNYAAFEKACFDDLDLANDTLFTLEAKIESFQLILDEQKSRDSLVPSVSNELNASFRIANENVPKLEDIKVPTFDGDLLNFPSFKALFENLVHNANMPGVRKLHHLKKSFEDSKVYHLICDFPLTEAGYNEAWALVISRFKNRRAVTRSLFRQLYSIESITSPQKIRSLIDEVDVIMRGLKAAGEKIDDTFSRFICYTISRKLDKKTLEDWENSITSNKVFPLYNDLQKFLQNRLFTYEEMISEKTVEKPRFATKPLPKNPVKNNTKLSFAVEQLENCVVCNKNPHPVYKCAVFLSKSPQDRYALTKSNKLCIVCLQPGHSVRTCPNTSFKCKCRCGELHNYLLHFKPSSNASQTNESKSENAKRSTSAEKVEKEELNPKQTFSCSTPSIKNEVVLLPSALVRFRSGNITGIARILLDSCSQPTMASDTFVRKFKIPSFGNESSIKGVSSSSIRSAEAINLVIGSRNNKFSLEIQADVVPANCLSYSATVSFPSEIVKKLQGLELAEPCLVERNVHIHSVDIVVGAKYFVKCMADGKAQVDTLDLQRSKFGWIVSGVTPTPVNSETRFCGLTINEVNKNLEKFWRIEEVEEEPFAVKPMTNEEKNCVEHFERTYSFADDGKFIVKLPLKKERNEIARTRKRAENSLLRVERKLDSNLKAAYSAFMGEYLDLKHMTRVVDSNPNAYHIPHREVLRETSTTTPLRVVFNASAKAGGKCSLNDALMIGPNLQRDIFDILISFREHKYVCVGDVEKMYRMIWVHPTDRVLQGILWRFSPADPIVEYQLNTLTYGTASASFIAQKCLIEIAQSCAREYPEVAKVIKENFYMDNVNIGASSEDKLILLREKICSVLMKRGFKLRKFASNSVAVLRSLAPDLRSINKNQVEFIENSEVSVLGINWFPAQDEIGIRVNLDKFENSSSVSRRVALSTISKTFDPLGLLAPVLIKGKLLLQDFWKEKKDWDCSTSDELNIEFRKYVEDTNLLNEVRIPRHIVSQKLDSIFAFCDASKLACCAIVYARYLNSDGSYNCRFICAKTRVAPMKDFGELTIPRLELQAALLLSNLVKKVCANFEMNIGSVVAFSDSTTVLCWLSKVPDEWKTFVRNRSEKILKTLPFCHWRYVKSAANPADKATRGLSTEEFEQCSKIWFEGPEFVKYSNADTFYSIPDVQTQDCLEKRRHLSKSLLCSKDNSLLSTLERFSSFSRLINCVARLVRFVKRWKNKIRAENVVFSSAELLNARNIVIRAYQYHDFAVEIESLKKGVELKRKNPFRALDPFLDENEILRVGGRLKKSLLPLEKKHPIIMSAKSYFVKLYCRYIHEKYYHCSRKFLLAFLCSEFWICRGKSNMVKSVIRNCISCQRMKGRAASQIMGQLPLPRIQVSRPFSYVGVDYAGYFECKCTAHRSAKFFKIYAAIFVCLTTRAIHIEIVTDLSSDALIEAVSCFTARRGLPLAVYSDNGSNMQGAKNFLETDEEKLKSFAAHEKFDWYFIPPISPNFGGIWEAGVKSSKWHLNATIKGQVFSIVEYGNIFRKIEAILNSRPLCYREDPEQGSEILTPAHFLVGGSLLSLPVIDYDDTMSLSKRLLLLQNQLSGFWKVWSRDYINQLQQRNRWTRRSPSLKEGQIVFVRSEGYKPFQWPLGKIVETFPDPDGDVRVVKVLFRGKTKIRSISAIVPLMSEEQFLSSN